MFIGIDRNEIQEYSSILDPDKENPTKFLLGIISCKDRTILAAKFEDKEDPAVFYDVVKKGLKGIKNVKDKAGEVKNYDTITDDVLDLLSTALIKELFFKIIDINFLNEQERKN